MRHDSTYWSSNAWASGCGFGFDSELVGGVLPSGSGGRSIFCLIVVETYFSLKVAALGPVVSWDPWTIIERTIVEQTFIGILLKVFYRNSENSVLLSNWNFYREKFQIRFNVPFHVIFYFGRMYFDLPFCVKKVKSVKSVTLNVGN